MTQLNSDILALLDAADADRAYVTINVSLPGDRTIPINFAATAASSNSFRTLRVVLAVDVNDESPTAGIDRTLQVLEWLRDMAATDNDRALIDELDRRGHLHSESLSMMLQTLVEMTAGRPTMPSQSSPAGSPSAGQTSTVPSPSQAAMPAPSVSTSS